MIQDFTFDSLMLPFSVIFLFISWFGDVWISLGLADKEIPWAREGYTITNLFCNLLHIGDV
jgi:hypothetical protein